MSEQLRYFWQGKNLVVAIKPLRRWKRAGNNKRVSVFAWLNHTHIVLIIIIIIIIITIAIIIISSSEVMVIHIVIGALGKI